MYEEITEGIVRFYLVLIELVNNLSGENEIVWEYLKEKKVGLKRGDFDFFIII